MSQPSPDQRPLVVAVEGPCFAGKSTLVTRLKARLGAEAAAEYAELAALPPFPPRDHQDVVAALQHFLALEHGRAALGRQVGRRGRSRVLICDRSPLTLISYETGVAQLCVMSDPALATEMFSAAADQGMILRPDVYIYLRITPRAAAARQARRGPVARHLMDRRVRAAMDLAARRYLNQVPPPQRLELDGSLDPDVLTEAATAFVTAQPSPGHATPPSWRVLSFASACPRSSVRGIR